MLKRLNDLEDLVGVDDNLVVIDFRHLKTPVVEGPIIFSFSNTYNCIESTSTDWKGIG
jgi:hypothetical protein